MGLHYILLRIYQQWGEYSDPAEWDWPALVDKDDVEVIADFSEEIRLANVTGKHQLIDEIYNATDSWGAEMVDKILANAGVIWNCEDEDCRWTNRFDDDVCQQCRKPR